MLTSYFRNTLQGVWLPLRAGHSHAALLRMLLRREIANRSSGTLLGRVWPLLQPALQMLGFWFLFDIVYGMRADRGSDFLSYLLVGMLPWLCLTEVLNRAAGMFREFGALYSRTPFPIELLPLVVMLIPGIVYTVVYALVCLLLAGPAAALTALLVMPLLLLWLLPLVLLVSVFGAFIRDFAQALPFVLMLVMYCTPILYFPDMLPDWFHNGLWLNPFADLVAVFHAAIEGRPLAWPQPVRLLGLWLLLLGPAWLLFRRALPHVREVL
jgi:lipopolysaccharide transport system permease protein